MKFNLGCAATKAHPQVVNENRCWLVYSLSLDGELTKEEREMCVVST